MNTNKPQWTEEYYGIQHLGELRDHVRVTVTRVGNRAVLYKFSHSGVREETFSTVTKAKQEGERWIKARKD